MNLNEVIDHLIELRDEAPNVGTFEVVCAEEETFYGISNIIVDLELAEVKIN